MSEVIKKEKFEPIKADIPKVENVPLKDKIYNFNGQWLPSVDPILIGAENFQELINMRYCESGIEGVNGNFDFNSTAIVDHININSGLHFRTNRTADSYLLVHASDSSGNGEVHYSNSAVGTAEGTGVFNTTALHADASANLTGRFGIGPSGVVAYCNQEESLVWEGTEADVMAVFSSVIADVDGAAALPIDETDVSRNRIVSDYFTIDTDDRGFALILSTAPLQGFKLYVDPSNANENAATTDTLVVKHWTGTSFDAVTTLVDGTEKLTKTGTLSFVSTVSTAKAKHFKERYAYAYTVEVTMSAAVHCVANIYQITVDKPMQAITNIWDGIYRKPIQAQRYQHSNTSYEDFTLHVREPSTVDLPVGLYVGQLVANDFIYLMFDDRMAAIKLTMLGSLLNVADAQFTAADGIQYWNGSAWANLTYTDETLDTAGDSSCSQTGLLYWTPPTDEEQKELFGTIGYAYRLSIDGTFTGTADSEVTVDIVTGIPAQEDVEIYKFPAQYKNKLMMCGFVEGNQGNRIDFSVDNNPHMFNGLDSSDNGYQSIYVGSVEEITAATQLYNRFGSNILSMFVILKNNEVWLMTGDTPVDYKLYPISFGVGCPAPGTLCTAEVGFNVGEDVERNVAMWVSHQGPVMFDGAIIHPVKGIENYFDPNDSDSVNFTYFNDSQSWFDSTNNEWNILIPTSTSTYLNTWLVYDVRRKKWFKKSWNLGSRVTCGIQAIATTGDQYIYGGSNDGRIYELETGNSWNGSDITGTVTVGDFFPTGSQWDESLIRRLKLVTKKLDSSGATVSIYYRSDTNTDSGLSLTWSDVTLAKAETAAGLSFVDVIPSLSDTSVAGLKYNSAPASSLDMTTLTGSNRVVKVTNDLNEIAWSHSFKFEFISSDEVFKPLMWGIQSSKIRTEKR